MIEPTIEQGIAHQRAGNLPQAEAIYRQILQREPSNSDALHLLGAIAYQVGQHETGVELASRAVRIKPNIASYHNTLGLNLMALRRLDEATAAFRAAVQLQPTSGEIHFNLGNSLHQQGLPEKALPCYRTATTLAPRMAIAYINLGSALSGLDQLKAAKAAYLRAIEIQPNLAEAHFNLGNALRCTDQFEPAIACYRRTLELKPDHVGALMNLGNLLKEKGELDNAIECFDRALAVNPNDSQAHSNLLFTQQLHWRYNARAIFEQHVEWRKRHADPLKRLIRPHANTRDPNRPIRIGYVSPDFREHSVARFMLPLLKHHDRRQFEIICYANIDRADEMTTRVQSLVDEWRNIRFDSDDAAADIIRQDRIDILVDLALHTAHNRLLVFARKPAPVQVTYLAYCGTSGLDTIDYRLTDERLDPNGVNDPFYSERSIYLPRTYWCYDTREAASEVNALPAMTMRAVTFGCLNNLCKVTSPTLTAWARIMNELPGSRLILHILEGTDSTNLLNELAGMGVESSRVMLLGHVPFDDYLRLYHQIDIALDPFPYNGGTTTCDALWMGVPVVSKAGQRAVERAGLSLLSAVGLPELVGVSEDEYVKIACELARDLPRLAKLRATLRPMMQASPLMDGPDFARDVEAAFRNIWRRWCES